MEQKVSRKKADTDRIRNVVLEAIETEDLSTLDILGMSKEGTVVRVGEGEFVTIKVIVKNPEYDGEWAVEDFRQEQERKEKEAREKEARKDSKVEKVKKEQETELD